MQTFLNKKLPSLPLAAVARLNPKFTLGLIGLYLLITNFIISNDQNKQFTAINLCNMIVGLVFMLSILLPNQLPKLLTWLARFPGWMGIYPAQAILLISSPFLGLTAGSLSIRSSIEIEHPWIASCSWVLSLVAVMAGAINIPNQTGRPQLKILAWLTGFFILGLSTRIFFLESIPVSWTGDEGASGLAALEILMSQPGNIFSGSWHSFPSFYFAMQGIPILIMGRTFEALRITSAIAGALAVACSYLLGRALYGHRTGVLTAILLAGLHFHIHFSRIGLLNVWDSLWYIVTLGALWVAWEKEHRNTFLLAGISMGMAQLFYPSARLVVLIAILWLVIAASMNRPRFWRVLPDLFIMGLAALIVILPMAVYFSIRLNEYLGPVSAQSEMGNLIRQSGETGTPLLWIVLKQIWLGLQAYIYTPLKFWYKPGVPILRMPEAILFMVGLLALLARPKDNRLYLLLLWLVSFGIIGGLSESTPAAQRYVAAAPLAALIAAIGLEAIARLLEKVQIPVLQKILTAIVIISAVILAGNDSYFYFREYIPNSYYTGLYDGEGEGGLVAREAGKYLRTQPSDYEGVFIGYPRIGYYSVPSMQYVAPNINGYTLIQPWGDPSNPVIPTDKLIFIVLADKTDDLNAVQTQYPGGYLREYNNAYGQLAFYTYQTPPPAVIPDIDTAPALQILSPVGRLVVVLIILLVIVLGFASIAILNRLSPATETLILPAKQPWEWNPGWKLTLPAFLRARQPKLLPTTNAESPVNAEEPVLDEAGQVRTLSTVGTIKVDVQTIDPRTARVSVEFPLETGVQVVIDAIPPVGENPLRVSVNAQPAGRTSQILPEKKVPALSQPMFSGEKLTGRFKQFWEKARARISTIPLDSALFAFAILVYLIMISTQLENFPIYFFTDEAVHMNQAAHFIENGFTNEQGEFLPTYFSLGPSFSINSVSVYVQVLPYLFFGKSEFITRMVSGLITLLGAIAVALAMKKVFKSRAYWAAILFLIVNPAWFLHARTAFEYMELSAFYGMFLYFYLRYREGEPNFLYAAVGAGALTFYTHGLGQALMGVTGVVLFLADIRYHFKPEHRRIFLGALLMVGILLLPYVRYQISHPSTTAEQIRQRGSYLFDNQYTTYDKVVRFGTEYLSGLNPQFWFSSETNDLIRHKMLGYSHLWWGAMPFVAIGLLVALWNIKKPAYRVVLLALLTAPVPQAVAGLGVTRILWFMVPVAMLATIGLTSAIDWLENNRKFSYKLASLVMFVIMSASGLYMLRDALTNGPLWYQDYTLYGMQYGGRQIFQDLVLKKLMEDPNAQFVISPNWANGTDQLYQFFIPNQYQGRAVFGSVDDVMNQKRDFDPNTIFIAIPDEYKRAIESPKFKKVEVVGTIPYPNGMDGFYLLHLTYADNIDEILAAEEAERRKPVTESITVGNQLIDITYSRIESGQISDIFDGDPYTFIRGIEANPFVIDMRYTDPQAFKSLALTVGTMDNFTVTVRLYEKADSQPVEYSQTFVDLGSDPTVNFQFDQGPASFTRIEVLINFNSSTVGAKIHVRDLILK